MDSSDLRGELGRLATVGLLPELAAAWLITGVIFAALLLA
jgi:hypothetical protein